MEGQEIFSRQVVCEERPECKQQNTKLLRKSCPGGSGYSSAKTFWWPCVRHIRCSYFAFLLIPSPVLVISNESNLYIFSLNFILSFWEILLWEWSFPHTEFSIFRFSYGLNPLSTQVTHYLDTYLTSETSNWCFDFNLAASSSATSFLSLYSVFLRTIDFCKSSLLHCYFI